MNVSSALPNLLYPYGSGLGLPWLVAPGATPNAGAARPVEPVRAADGLSRGRPDRPVCGTSDFEIEDTVELTAVQIHDAASTKQFSDEQRAQVEKLREGDREIRAHERAHLAAAGPYALGGATFEYQVGPDGRRYAIGGEVTIDTEPIAGDPQASIRKMEQVRAAALAPADPSGQDLAVAAQAATAIQDAEAELARGRTTEGVDEAHQPAPDVGTADRASPSRRHDPRFARDRHPAAVLVDSYA